MGTVYFCLWIFLSYASAADIVAFTKGLASERHFTKGEIVDFDKDIYNKNAFFTVDNKFQVQIPGLYVFHIHTLSKKDKEVWLDLYKNSDYVLSVYASTYNDWADSGNAVVLDLRKGDLVLVKAVDDYENDVYGAPDDIYTTFSGALINPASTSASGNIGFTATLTYNMTINGTAVIYDKVITNAGSGYDVKTGVFTASVDGFYAVHYHGLSEFDEILWLDLYRNDQYINSAYANSPSTWAGHGNTAVLELKAGDRLTVNGRQGATTVLEGDIADEQLYSTFTAYYVGSATHGNNVVDAFSVGLTRDLDNSDASNTNARFDRVWTNQNGGFNMATAEYTAKTHGVYAFHYHALAGEDGQVFLDFYHNNVYINTVYGHQSRGWAGGSNSAMLELKVHDTVYISMKNYTNSLGNGPTEVYATFSGFMLSQITGNN